jgi:hypothetical protein
LQALAPGAEVHWPRNLTAPATREPPLLNFAWQLRFPGRRQQNRPSLKQNGLEAILNSLKLTTKIESGLDLSV